MKKLTGEKGITLIALIITIIVMLILVGVTINVALNGGLFDKAKDAAKDMEEQAMYEQIVMGMQLDGSKIDIEETYNEAVKALKGYTIEDVESGTNYRVINVVGKNGIYTYTITDEGVMMGNKKPSVPPIVDDDNNDDIVEDIVHSGVIPEGGTYYVGVTGVALGDYTGATAIYETGDSFPDTTSVGDVYVYGDYEYRYQLHYDLVEKSNQWTTSNTDGWGVKAIDTTKNSYGEIISQINNKDITSLVNIFDDCINMSQVPTIPESTINMSKAFSSTAISTVTIPSNVEKLSHAFSRCDNITTITINSSKLTEMSNCIKDSHSESIIIYVPADSNTYTVVSDYISMYKGYGGTVNIIIETF